MAIGLCSASLSSSFVPAVGEVVAVAEIGVPSVAHVGPDACAFAIWPSAPAIINIDKGQVVDHASVLE